MRRRCRTRPEFGVNLDPTIRRTKASGVDPSVRVTPVFGPFAVRVFFDPTRGLERRGPS